MRKAAVKPDHWLRKKVFALVNSAWFMNFITLCVVINVACMATKSYQIHYALELTLRFFNMIFTIIFNLEMVLKLVALKSAYFYSNWN